MLKRNTSDSYPGASYVAADPVTESDCCRARSVAAIAAQCDAGDVPYAIRMGKIFVDISEEELADTCLGVEPEIASVESEPITEFVANAAIGTNFSAAPLSLWLTEAATWAASEIRVEQTGVGAGDLRFDFDPVPGALPRAPAKVYVYVFNGCGRANAVGFETTFAP